MNYKILILSNEDNEEFIEDNYIAESFRNDGNEVSLLWVDYDEQLDEKFDIIIRRNTWTEDINKINYFSDFDEKLVERLKEKKIKTVNLEGLDGIGKEYLCAFYQTGEKVIPTVSNIEDTKKFKNISKYVLKEIDSLGSGIGQKIVKKDDLAKEFKEGYLIQPKIEFKSEVQCYFVADKLMYVFEYIPSKYPNYPKPQLIKLNNDQEKLAYHFAQKSNLKVGFQRIDFLKLNDDSFLLLEIEDNSPHMNLEELDSELRDKVLEEYKKNIYQFLNNKRMV